MSTAATADRLGGCRDLPIPVVVHLLEGVETRLGDLAAHVGAKLAVHTLPDGIVVLPCEADAVDRGSRHDGGEDQPGQREEVDRALAQLRQHGRVAAELVVRKDLDLDGAVALRLDALGRLGRVDGERVRDRGIVGVLQCELGAERLRDMEERYGAGSPCRADEPAPRQFLQGISSR
jgi:hypothetical protein